MATDGPLQLFPCTKDDIPNLIPVYFDAFQETIISRKCFPRTPTVERWWLNMLLDEFQTQPGAHFVKVVKTGESGSEEIVAFGKWVHIRPLVDPPAPPDLPQWPDDPASDHELANRFFGALFKAHDDAMSGKQHWYLELIATSPKARGLGAGKLIVQWGIERAMEQSVDGDEQGKRGVPCFLEASPKGKAVFEKQGFRQIGKTLRVPFDEEVWEETFMIRE